MLSNPLIAFANTYEFEILEDCAYGYIDSYLVSVSNVGYKKTAFINFYTPETEAGDSVVGYKLSESIKSAELVAAEDYEIFINGVLIRTGADLKDFDLAVTKICGILKQHGFLSMPVCSECGYPVDDTPASIAIINNRAAFLCDDCTNDAKDAVNSVENKKEGSKKLGWLGAVLGGLVGLIVTVILYIFVIPGDGIKLGKDDADKLSSLIFTLPLSALLCFLSFVFYRLFSKRKGAERILPCFVISTVLTLLGVYTSTAIVYTNYFGLDISGVQQMISTILAAPFTDRIIRPDFVRHMGYSLASVIAVALIYSLVLDGNKDSKPIFIPLNEENAVDEDKNEVEAVEVSEENA